MLISRGPVGRGASLPLLKAYQSTEGHGTHITHVQVQALKDEDMLTSRP